MRLSDITGDYVSAGGIMDRQQFTWNSGAPLEYSLLYVEGNEEVYVNGSRFPSGVNGGYITSPGQITLNDSVEYPINDGDPIILIGKSDSYEIPYTRTESQSRIVPTGTVDVFFDTISTEGIEIYIVGPNDRGRLIAPDDFTIVSGQQITLAKTYATNVTILGVQAARLSYVDPDSMAVYDGTTTKSLGSRFRDTQETLAYYHEKEGRQLQNLEVGLVIEKWKTSSTTGGMTKDSAGYYPKIIHQNIVWEPDAATTDTYTVRAITATNVDDVQLSVERGSDNAVISLPLYRSVSSEPRGMTVLDGDLGWNIDDLDTTSVCLAYPSTSVSPAPPLGTLPAFAGAGTVNWILDHQNTDIGIKFQSAQEFGSIDILVRYYDGSSWSAWTGRAGSNFPEKNLDEVITGKWRFLDDVRLGDNTLTQGTIQTGYVHGGALPGSTTGLLVKGQEDGHTIIAVPANDNEDSFAVLSNSSFADKATFDRPLFRVSNAGQATILGNTVWHAGNDGAGSGLDADLLGGLPVSSFAKADGSTPISGQMNFDAGASIVFPAESKYDKISLWGNSSYSIGMISASTHGWTNAEATTFTMGNSASRGWLFRNSAHGPTDGAMSLTTDGRLMIGSSGGTTGRIGFNDNTGVYIDQTAGNINAVTPELTVNGNKVWHQGNDGPSSGLQAQYVGTLQQSDIMSEWTAVDGANTTRSIGPSKFLKYQQGTGMQIRLTDTNSGASADPYDMTFTVLSAPKWTTPRTLTLTGNVTGSATIDGSGNVSMATSVVSAPTTTINFMDGDTGVVGVSGGSYMRFQEGGGININWTDTSTGSSSDPFDLQFNVTSAPQWTTSRTITLAGDLTGSVSMNGSSNVTLTASVLNNSHSHSNYMPTTTRYCGLTSDGTYNQITLVNKSGTDAGWLRSPASGFLPDKTGTSALGTSSWRWSSVYANTLYEGTTALSSKYLGISSNAASASKWASARTITVNGDASGAVSIDGSANKTLTLDVTYATSAGSATSAGYWTTARTLTLTGDCSGYTSIRGNGNMSLAVTVANDSHTHDGRYYTEAESNSRFAAASHNHNSLYYTETESDGRFARLNGVSNQPFTAYSLHCDFLIAVNNITAFNGSDIRIKRDIKKVDSALDKIDSLSGNSFYYIEPAAPHLAGKQHGLLAQELQQVIPEMVSEDDKGMLKIKTGGHELDALYIEAIKELRAEIEELKAKIK